MKKLTLEIFQEPADEGDDYICRIVELPSVSTFGATEWGAVREMGTLLEGAADDLVPLLEDK